MVEEPNRRSFLPHLLGGVAVVVILILLLPLWIRPHFKNARLMDGDLKAIAHRAIYVRDERGQRFGPMETDATGQFDVPKGILRASIDGYVLTSAIRRHYVFSPPAPCTIELLDVDGKRFQKPVDLVLYEGNRIQLKVEHGFKVLPNMPSALRPHLAHLSVGGQTLAKKNIERIWDGKQLKLRIVVPAILN